jgi:hypothetical protein
MSRMGDGHAHPGGPKSPILPECWKKGCGASGANCMD